MFPSVPTPPAPVATCRAMLLAALAAAVLLLLAASDASARSRHTVEHNADGSTTARTGVVRAAPGGGGDAAGAGFCARGPTTVAARVRPSRIRPPPGPGGPRGVLRPFRGSTTPVDPPAGGLSG